MPGPLVISRDDLDETSGPEALREFLEKLVEASANRAETVIGEAEPGRHLLVSPPLATATLKEQIDAAVGVVLETLGRQWPAPHVTDLGLREFYPHAREPWLARRGFEALVSDGKLGVVTIFCHEWVYDVCERVATENGVGVQGSREDYLRTGKFRLAGTNAFQIDVFANLREMAANFDPIDALATKVLVLAGLSGDETLAARLRRKE